MNQQQLQELEERLDRIESDLLRKLEKLNGLRDRNWLQRNLGLVISTGTILVTLAGAWSRVETAINHLQRESTRLEARIAVNGDLMRAHHESTSVHVDQAWKREMKDDITEIRILLIEHMSTNGKVNK